MTMLEAVRDAVLADASAQADALRAAARERAERILAGARAEASALLGERRDAVTRLADLHERERLAEARAQAAATVLAARRRVLTEARSAVVTAARRLTADPRYEPLLERLAADARRRLRDGEPVRIVPVADGGFIAHAGSRQIDCSLDAQVDRCLEAMAGELERVWR